MSTQETRDARKRTRTLRTLFAAVEKAVQATPMDTFGVMHVELNKSTTGGFTARVTTHDRTCGLQFAWGPEGSLEEVPLPTTDPAQAAMEAEA